MPTGDVDRDDTQGTTGSASEGQLGAIMAHAPIALFALDRAGMITLSEGQGLTALRRSWPQETVGRSVFDVYRDVPEIVAYARRALAGEECAVVVMVGGVVCDVRYVPVRDGGGTVDGVIGVATDVTARARAEEALQHLVLHDALTGLPNRTLLHDRLEQALRVAERARGPLALLLLDLDRFKEINDTCGHHVGDALLRQVRPRLHRVLRSSDTVARLGGDEFAVLLPDGGQDGAVAVARKIHAALDTPFAVEGQTLGVGVSIGIALYPAHGGDGATLLRHADVAMYVAKRSHSGGAVYDPAQDGHSPDRLALFADLRRAIAQNALLLHYQPTIDLATGRMRSVEALVRWPHPAHGVLPPDQFIPLAEQTGLIAPLTHRVLEAALRQRQVWAREGLGLGMAVNLSMHNLHDLALPDTIAGLLQTYGVPPAALRVELTESAVMVDPERSRQVLTRLAALGVRSAIDDFGTGYTSLAALKHLPVDELKIDKGFVLHLADDAADAAIVSATIGLGHGLGMQVVAEGVESRETWEVLAALRCDAAQGYYVSRPLPAAAIVGWLQAAL